MNAYAVTVLWNDLNGDLRVFEHVIETETAVAFRTCLSRGWTAFCAHAEPEVGEDEDLHGLVRSIEIRKR